MRPKDGAINQVSVSYPMHLNNEAPISFNFPLKGTLSWLGLVVGRSASVLSIDGVYVVAVTHQSSHVWRFSFEARRTPTWVDAARNGSFTLITGGEKDPWASITVRSEMVQTSPDATYAEYFHLLKVAGGS